MAKLQAVAAFKQLPEAAALAAANKRVQNLLKKADAELGAVNESLLQQDEEKALYAAAQGLQPKISAAVAEGNFQTALSELASVKPQVDAFFDSVMVMAEDAAVKQKPFEPAEPLGRTNERSCRHCALERIRPRFS